MLFIQCKKWFLQMPLLPSLEEIPVHPSIKPNKTTTIHFRRSLSLSRKNNKIKNSQLTKKTNYHFNSAAQKVGPVPLDDMETVQPALPKKPSKVPTSTT